MNLHAVLPTHSLETGLEQPASIFICSVSGPSCHGIQETTLQFGPGYSSLSLTIVRAIVMKLIRLLQSSV